MRTRHDRLSMGCSKVLAAHASVLAFRCAWAEQTTHDLASAKALQTYKNLQPRDHDAADRVVEALVDAIRLRPHWVDM